MKPRVLWSLASMFVLISATFGYAESPVVSLSPPPSLSFGSQSVGTTSAAQAVTLNTSGKAALTITSIVVTGVNAGDFTQTNTCSAALAPGSTCKVSVTFKPTGAGDRKASLTITDNASDSPQTVGLTGIGGAPPAAGQHTSVEQGIKEFRWVFGLMTGVLVLIVSLLTFALVNISRTGKWSLADALSEESAIQPPPSEIHSAKNVITFASTSRLIALVGLLCSVPVIIGVAYAIVWNLVVNGTCPDLPGVRTFLTGISLTFAPYLANQVRSIFDPGLGSKPPAPSSQVQVQPTPPAAQGPVTAPSHGQLPQPTPMPAPSQQSDERAGLVQVRETRRIPTTHIEQVPQLAPHLDRLKSHGIRTTHQLMGTAHAAERALAEFLHLKPEELRRLLKKLPHSAELSAALRKPQPKFPMGARAVVIPRPFVSSAWSGLASPAPQPGVNLIPQMPAVRDQGLVRQTCVAFAALATFEHYLSSQNSYIGLSEQYLYWDCKRNDGQPNVTGTQLGLAMGLLEGDGCCTDSAWQYNTSQMPGNEGEGPPPPEAMADAASHKIDTYHPVVPSTVIPDPIDAIRSELGRQRCVAFTIPVFQSSFNNENVRETGDFINPLGNSSDLRIEDHSMCIVGYEDNTNDSASGGGRFYVRNSWDQWATQSPLGIGYGTISYSYIANWCVEAYSIN